MFLGIGSPHARRAALAFTLLLMSLAPSPIASGAATAGIYKQERRHAQADLALEIILPNDSRPPNRHPVSNGARGMWLIRRDQLTINDPKAAGDLTAIDVWADGEADSIKVRLSVIYNDLSNQEWWKDKKEKILGTYPVREGESVRPLELAQFGIEPFEMKVISARPIVFQSGQGPRIKNNTRALEVARLEKTLHGFQLWLKNTSGRNIVAYSISEGSDSAGTSHIRHRGTHSALASGAVSEEIVFFGENLERGGITIELAVFEDGSFEGDPKLAAEYLSRSEGVRIQLPHVLLLVERALEADDTQLQEAFDKLEAQLWAMPEAIDKQSALELLKTRFASFDEKTLSRLYEELKGGLYDARNLALSPIGDFRRNIQERLQGEAGDITEVKTRFLRDTLTQMKDSLYRITRGER